MSDTPRTDAAEIDNSMLSDEGVGPSGYVHVDFARQLERELNKANKELQAYQTTKGNTMKTAEEWATDINGIKWLDNSHPTMTNVVKQIQLDAMKEGMRRAATIVRTTKTEQGDQYGSIRLESPCSPQLQQAILTAAEQLTEKEL